MKGSTLVIQTTSSSSSLNQINLSDFLQWSRESLPINVLVNSGGDDSLIDSVMVQQAFVPVLPVNNPKTVSSLDGKLLAKVTHGPVQVTVLILINHTLSYCSVSQNGNRS